MSEIKTYAGDKTCCDGCKRNFNNKERVLYCEKKSILVCNSKCLMRLVILNQIKEVLILEVYFYHGNT